MAAGKKLELEFARLANIVDDRKALSVGTSEQNRAKNQSDTVIPFDRNRVILTPDGQRPDSTYINASFIEGYHNDESFIITQVCTKYRITLRILRGFVQLYCFYLFLPEYISSEFVYFDFSMRNIVIAISILRYSTFYRNCIQLYNFQKYFSTTTPIFALVH